MFAVIKTGGKQYSVKADDQLRVEKLPGEVGDMVEFSEVLMVGNAVGAPVVDGAMVTAEIVEQGRARKVIAFKKRRRQNSRRTIGHRQHYTLLQISEILTDGKKPSKKSQGLGAAKAAAKAAKAESAGSSAEADADAKAATAKGDLSVETDTDTQTDKAVAAKADEKPAAKPAKKDDAAEAPAAPLFTAPAGGEKDKLTDIKGIGPVAERQLNEQGITTFAQIAALTEEDIERVDEYMPFSADQIRDWQGQAKDKA
ncbi:MAG: 50S ribosomal protein L21 [Pseudomonadota bacterium]